MVWSQSYNFFHIVAKICSHCFFATTTNSKELLLCVRWKFGNLLAVFEIYRWIKLYALPPCFPVSKVYGTKTLIEFQGLLWGPSLPLSVHPEGWGQGQGGQNPIHPNQDHQRRQPNTNHVQLGAATTKFHGKKKSPMHGSRTCSSKPFQWIPTRGNILLILLTAAQFKVKVI